MWAKAEKTLKSIMEKYIPKIKSRRELQIQTTYILRQKHSHYHYFKKMRRMSKNLFMMLRLKTENDPEAYSYRKRYNQDLSNLKKLEPEKWAEIHELEENSPIEEMKEEYKKMVIQFKKE